MLPASISLSFLVGALLAEIAKAAKPGFAERYLVPIASGAIAGESILGVVAAALNNFVL